VNWDRPRKMKYRKYNAPLQFPVRKLVLPVKRYL